MILQIYTIIQTLITLVAIFTSFVIPFGMLATAPAWVISVSLGKFRGGVEALRSVRRLGGRSQVGIWSLPTTR
jgi:hypothetical protein